MEMWLEKHLNVSNFIVRGSGFHSLPMKSLINEWYYQPVDSSSAAVNSRITTQVCGFLSGIKVELA